MSLQTQLDAFATAMSCRVSPERMARKEEAFRLLRGSGVGEAAIRVGDVAPDFVLRNGHGQQFSLAELRARGPVVLDFFRGGWCPFCTMELRAYQQMLPAFQRLGACVVAISPQSPARAADAALANDITFPVLSDTGMKVGSQYGLVHTLPQGLIDVYRAFGHDLPTLTGDPGWRLPIPATYVVAPDGRVVFAHVDPDPRKRAEPADVLAAIQAMAVSTAP